MSDLLHRAAVAAGAAAVPLGSGGRGGQALRAPVVAIYHDAISGPEGIVAGPDGALWFTNYTGNSIGRITTTGQVTTYTGTGINSPEGMTADPDGALWFTKGGTPADLYRRQLRSLPRSPALNRQLARCRARNRNHRL